jgi:large subunit ribosomal protein L9
MKVLLKEDIKKLGWFGEIVEVNNGYARNYLLPQGLATTVSEDSIRSLAEEKARRAEQRIKEKNRLEEAAKAVDGAEAVIAAKANEQGHLFGSVTEHQIAANLREQGFTVADEVVHLHDHIKEVGTHQVKLRFAENVVASVNVVVVPEQNTTEQAKTEE